MTDNAKTMVFISFATQELTLAVGIKRYIEKAFPASLEVFVSDTTITAGELWENAIRKNIQEAELVFVVCSTLSVLRPWVNFKRGAGLMGKAKVIALCHSGLRRDELIEAWGKWDGDALDIHNVDCGKNIVHAVSHRLGIHAQP